MKKVAVFLAEGFEECEGLLVVDILRRADVEVVTASVMKRLQITSSHGVKLQADALAEDIDYDTTDMIVLPGGMPGTAHLSENKIVREQCVAFAEGAASVDDVPDGRQRVAVPEENIEDVSTGIAGTIDGKKYIAAICAAPSVLAQLGLLDGKRATCHTNFEDKMAGAVVTRESVTVADNVITGQGLGAAIPFALKLVEVLADKETAEGIAKAICW
jgi:4-methyl-5(b-hydroxyethyl)-thiazole monophosphate biosynthesis